MNRCSSGKVGHASESAARRAAIAVARVRTHDRPRVYACPHCHAWHLTSAPRRRPVTGRRSHQMYVPQPATPAEFEAWFVLHSTRGGQVVSAVERGAETARAVVAM
jgi:hypothetical protein